MARRYDVLECIGKGSFGDVHKGYVTTVGSQRPSPVLPRTSAHFKEGYRDGRRRRDQNCGPGRISRAKRVYETVYNVERWSEKDVDVLVWADLDWGHCLAFPHREDEIEDIQREIAVLAQCRSPHVTKYLGCQLVPETSKLYIIMEHMAGGSQMALMSREYCNAARRWAVGRAVHSCGTKGHSTR
eukprot:4730608-Pyramimonas_sp.AAC.1